MTTLKEAAKAVLAVVDSFALHTPEYLSSPDMEAATVLRQALAQPESEPSGREALIAHHRHLADHGVIAGVRATAKATTDMLEADAQEIARSQAECDVIAEINHGQWLALENIRLLAARHRKEEWAQHILRFCDEAGSSATPWLAQQVAVPQGDKVAELSMMVRRLVLAVRRHVDDPHKDLTLANDCLKWLQKNDLAGSPMRDSAPQPAAYVPLTKAEIDAIWDASPERGRSRYDLTQATEQAVRGKT